MNTIDINSAMLVSAAGCFGIVIGFAVAALAYRQRLAYLENTANQAKYRASDRHKDAQREWNNVRALIAAGAGLTRAIADLRARKQGIGGTVDAAINAWTTARVEAESPDKAA